jgi:pimeloyl-ACP methyl ester carboxylesterase
MKESVVRLLSGRILETSKGGDLKGAPVLFLHGAPGSRLLYLAHADDARKRRIRLIGYSRPGLVG